MLLRLFSVLIFQLFCLNICFALTTETTSSGDWTDSANWDNGVPAATDSIIVNHAMILDTNLRVAGTGFLEITSGSSITDTAGGTAYTLLVENSGALTLNGDLSVEGSLNFKNNSIINVNACDTLTSGSATIGNNITFNIVSCAVWIVNGNLDLQNSVAINANGFIRVNGNVTSINNNTVAGTGNLSSSGTIIQSNSSIIFGSTMDYLASPCFLGTGFPLALEIAAFESRALCHNKIEVMWQVYDERDISHYALEMSTDTEKWILESNYSCNKMMGHNEYKTQIELDDLDYKYLRLAAINQDGRRSYSNIELIEFGTHLMQDEVSLFPNPAKGFAHIHGNYESYRVYNQLGVEVLAGSESKISLEGLALGSYVILLKH